MGNEVKERIKASINKSLCEEPELLYHINNPFLERYLDIIVDSICDEIDRVEKEIPRVLEKTLSKAFGIK